MQRLVLALATTVILSATGAPGAWAQPIPDLDADETPLHWAARNGLVGIAEGVLENGADIDAQDLFGRTPLHRAVADPAMVAFLIAEGANVNIRDVFGRTPLHEALPYVESVVLLIDFGADIDAEDFMGHTPLERATRLGTSRRNLTVVQLLIGAGAGTPGAD
ncbi:MAG: ankyrin repeat domain-containing protein [Spirochaetales bacterium]